MCSALCSTVHRRRSGAGWTLLVVQDRKNPRGNSGLLCSQTVLKHRVLRARLPLSPHQRADFEPCPALRAPVCTSGHVQGTPCTAWARRPPQCAAFEPDCLRKLRRTCHALWLSLPGCTHGHSRLVLIVGRGVLSPLLRLPGVVGMFYPPVVWDGVLLCGSTVGTAVSCLRQGARERAGWMAEDALRRATRALHCREQALGRIDDDVHRPPQIASDHLEMRLCLQLRKTLGGELQVNVAVGSRSPRSADSKGAAAFTSTPRRLEALYVGLEARLLGPRPFALRTSPAPVPDDE